MSRDYPTYGLKNCGQHFLHGRKWGVRSVVVEFGIFGAPRFSVQRSQNFLKLVFGNLWTENRGAPKTPNPTMTDLTPICGPLIFGNRPNTVSGSTVSNTELSEFFWPHRVPGSELSEFLSAYYLCARANSPSFSQNSPSLPQNSVSSLFRNSTLETVFRPFPRFS